MGCGITAWGAAAAQPILLKSPSLRTATPRFPLAPKTSAPALHLSHTIVAEELGLLMPPPTSTPNKSAIPASAAPTPLGSSTTAASLSRLPGMPRRLASPLAQRASPRSSVRQPDAILAAEGVQIQSDNGKSLPLLETSLPGPPRRRPISVHGEWQSQLAGGGATASSTLRIGSRKIDAHRNRLRCASSRNIATCKTAASPSIASP